MKKKWGALALAGVLGAAVVTGCSTGGKGEAAECMPRKCYMKLW